VAFAPAKPSISASPTANDELANLITYPFNVESVNQHDAAALVPTNQDEEDTSRSRRAGLLRCHARSDGRSVWRKGTVGQTPRSTMITNAAAKTKNGSNSMTNRKSLSLDRRCNGLTGRKALTSGSSSWVKVYNAATDDLVSDGG
jgi:hypothetical protein